MWKFLVMSIYFFKWRFAIDKWNQRNLKVAFRLPSLILMQHVQFTGDQSVLLLLVCNKIKYKSIWLAISPETAEAS